MKITKEQRSSIPRLRAKGLTILEISKRFKVHFQTINYHINPENFKKKHREYWNKLPKEKRKEISKKYDGYRRTWQRKKYQEDESFRETKKQRSRDYYKNKNLKEEVAHNQDYTQDKETSPREKE